MFALLFAHSFILTAMLPVSALDLTLSGKNNQNELPTDPSFSHTAGGTIGSRSQADESSLGFFSRPRLSGAEPVVSDAGLYSRMTVFAQVDRRHKRDLFYPLG